MWAALLVEKVKRGLLWYLKALTTAFILFVPFLIAVLGPRLIAAIFRSMGWTLRKKTDGRRAHLIALMDGESKRLGEKDSESKRSSSSGEWQKVQQADVDASAEEGDKSSQSWGGIVGFFHPFW